MIEKLYTFEDKKVQIIDNKGITWEGIVGDYCYADDEDPESIILDTSQSKYPEEFNQERIQSIEIIR